MRDDWRSFPGARDLEEDERMEARCRATEAHVADLLRETCRRLERETAIATTIALEVFRHLQAADVTRSDAVRDNLESQFGRYRDNDHLPNIRDLLRAIIR